MLRRMPIWMSRTEFAGIMNERELLPAERSWELKKLGLIGGMGPESTIPYYRDVVHGVYARAGRFPLLTIESVDVFHVLRLESENRLDELTNYLSAAIERVASAGAEVGALCANTPHIVFDDVQERSPIPLVSIVDACCDEARCRGFEKLGLLGTIPTMEGDFYRRAFRDAGMELVTPTADDRHYVAQKISEELEFGILRDETRVGLAAVVRRLRDESGIQAVVLGCTELPLILDNAATCVPCLDTVAVHVSALIDAVLADGVDF